MKHLYITISFLAFIFLSCSKEDNYSLDPNAKKAALVTIKKNNSSVGFYGEMDNQETIYISKLHFNYTPREGQRSIFYYSEYNQKVENYTYNTQIYSIENLLTDNVIKLKNQPIDQYNTNPINITRAWYGGGYINIEFEISISDDNTQKSYINLIDSTTIVNNKNYELVLTHKREPNSNKSNSLIKGFKCFKLNDIDPSIINISNYIINYTSFDDVKKRFIIKTDESKSVLPFPSLLMEHLPWIN